MTRGCFTMERTEFTTRLAEVLAAEDLSPATREVTERQARQFETWLRETTGEGIDPDDVHIAAVDLMEYRAFLQRKDTTPGSIQRHFASMRKSLLLLAPELAVRMRWPKLPTMQPTSPSGFTRNETHAIFRAAELMEPRDACIISLLMNVGCRASSLANLRLEDVVLNDRGGTATFRQAKGDRTVVVPLNSSARASVRSYLKVRPRGVEHGRLLCSERFLFGPITRGGGLGGLARPDAAAPAGGVGCEDQGPTSGPSRLCQGDGGPRGATGRHRCGAGAL
jgi:integrase